MDTAPHGMHTTASLRRKWNSMTLKCSKRWSGLWRCWKANEHNADLRRMIRTIRRLAEDSDVWPVVLLLFAVLVPAICLLWFMGAAMRNERLAARKKLADVYRVQLAASQTRLQEHWKKMVAELKKL